MKTLLLALSLLFSINICLAGELRITSAMSNNSSMPFIERNSALALNVNYHDVKYLRAEISKEIGRPLKFLQSWDRNGEAHVTTVTPPEFGKLSKYVSQETINRIAVQLDIQSSDIKILGIGSGRKLFGAEIGETFFVIVRSERLLKIRDAIYRAYVKNGGPATGPEAFNPKQFFPHVTIGFTHTDIHEADGLLKDVEHSLDRRFPLIID